MTGLAGWKIRARRRHKGTKGWEKRAQKLQNIRLLQCSGRLAVTREAGKGNKGRVALADTLVPVSVDSLSQQKSIQACDWNECLCVLSTDTPEPFEVNSLQAMKNKPFLFLFNRGEKKSQTHSVTHPSYFSL